MVHDFVVKLVHPTRYAINGSQDVRCYEIEGPKICKPRSVKILVHALSGANEKNMLAGLSVSISDP